MSNNEFTINDLDLDNHSAGRFDVRQILNKIRSNWLLILISAIAGLLLAYIYLSVTPPIYRTAAKILVKEDDPRKPGASMTSSDVLQTIGIAPGVNNVANELEIVKSFTLMWHAVSDLGLYVVMVNKGKGIFSKEYYKSGSPYYIHPSITDQKKYATITDQSFDFLEKDGKITLTNSGTGRQYSGSLNAAINLPGISITFSRNPAIKKIEDEDAAIEFYKIEDVADSYLERINFEIPNKMVSVVDLVMESSQPEKSRDLLNQIIKIYTKNGVADRNAISDSTIAFIDSRLAGVTSDLKNLESAFQDFKQRNEIVDISAQAKAMLENAGDFSKSAAEQEVQLSVVNSLIQFMERTSVAPRLVPASLTVDNAALSPVIAEYNKLLLERQRSLLSMTEENPVVVNIDNQLSEIRGNLLKGLQNMKLSAQSGLSTIKRNSGTIDRTLRTIPAKEREFLEYSRQQSIKQELYLFLLQRKEEAALSKSSTISNVRVIDAARSTSFPVKPKRPVILAVGLFLGLMFPLMWLSVKSILSNSINNKKEIEHLTQVPIVGEIGHYKNKQAVDTGLIVTEKNARHPVVEQFRVMRSNLNYTLGSKGKVIMITSENPGEGKSFISLNLAATFAISGQKTVVIGMDLRKPKISSALGLNGKKGVTQFLVGEASVDEIIYPVAGFEQLYAIPHGAIPPNPAELLMLDNTKNLITELRNRFDHIIIDISPKMVTDAYIVSQYSDVTLFITRIGITDKHFIATLDKMQQGGALGKMNIVVNDINFDKKTGYYEYYGYKGSDAYAYIDNNKRKKKWYWPFT